MWRGFSLRTLALLLVGPLLFDMLSVCFLFWMNLQSVRMGVPPWMQALIPALYALAYVVGAQLSGRTVTPKSAQWLVLLMCPAMTALGIVAVVVLSFPLYLVLGFAIGIATGFYFTPFQVAMGDVRPFRTLAWTIGFYNISWGTGCTLAPFVIWLKGCSGAAVAVVVGVLALVNTALALSARTAPRRPADESHMTVGFVSTGVQRLTSRIAAGLANGLTTGLSSTLWLALGDARGLNNRQIALGVAVMGLPVVALAPLWAWQRRRLIRPRVMIALMLLLAAAYVPVLYVPWPAALAPLALVGVCGSGLYFHGIYYANADPRSNARNVGAYESCVGLGALLGPLLLGLVAWTDKTSLRPFLVGALIMAAVAVLVICLHARDARQRTVDVDSSCPKA